MPNFIIIRPVGAEFFHADGWADRRAKMTKVMVDFLNSASTLNILNSWALVQRIIKKLLRAFYNLCGQQGILCHAVVDLYCTGP